MVIEVDTHSMIDVMVEETEDGEIEWKGLPNDIKNRMSIFDPKQQKENPMACLQSASFIVHQKAEATAEK